MPTSEEAAATAAEELVAGDEAQETASGTEDETTDEFPSFEVEIPADVQALLDEDDEEDLTPTDEEIDTLAEEHEDVPRDVLQRMVAAEKRAAHLEGLRTKEAKKNWEEEAKKVFPLSEPFLGEINATSRRGYLRVARDVHTRMNTVVEEKVLGPARKTIEEAKAKAIEEGKAEAKAAWGEPGGSNAAPSEAQTTLQRENRQRGGRELADTIKDMLFKKE